MIGLLRRLFPKKQKDEIRCSMIVLAAGSATRMEGEDKLMYELGGLPVVLHSLHQFQASPLVCEVILVTRQEILVDLAQLCKQYALTKVGKLVLGGASRMESVAIGMREVSKDASLIAVHDGARPFVSREVLEDVLYAATDFGAAVPVIPVKDTIKLVEEGMITKTPPRASLFAAQTPQAFEPLLLRGALAKALEDGAAVTDDCSMVERLGYSVAVVDGSEDNIKLTTPNDLLLSEWILSRRDPL